jgi:hypothetical protein
MRLGALLFGFVAFASAVAVSGQDNSASWSDEAIWMTLGKTHGFKNKLRTIIFEKQSVREQIRRTGVMPACRRIADFVDRTADAASDRYRAIIVAEARVQVPEGKTFQEQISIHPSGHRFGRLVESVERKAPDLFADLPTKIETDLINEMAKLPSAEGEWRGPVADWNFDGPNQSVWASACTISTLRNPADAKAAFDGFYQGRPAMTAPTATAQRRSPQ